MLVNCFFLFTPFLLLILHNLIKLLFMRHLLFVEDDNFFRSLVSEHLIKAGYDLKVAINLETAIAFNQEHVFDLILLDVTLPDGNGFEWAKQLASNPKRPPIIFLTSHSHNSDMRKGFELGGSDYMRKPIDLDELELRIKHVVSDFNTGAGHDRKIGEYLFNPVTFILSHKEHSTLLGQMQGAVLDELSRTIGQVVTKEDILNKYWGEANYFTSRNLDSVIVKLRVQMKKDKRIRFASLKKVGYQLLVNDQL